MKQAILTSYHNLPVYKGGLMQYVMDVTNWANSGSRRNLTREALKVEQQLEKMGAPKDYIGPQSVKPNGDPVHDRKSTIQALGALPSSSKPGGSPASSTASVSSGHPGAINKPQAYVESFSGPYEFYINGEKIEQQRQQVDLKGKQVADVRALLVTGKRKQAKDFQPTPNMTNSSHDDYSLMYQVSSGGFNGETKWQVVSEDYDWQVDSPVHIKATPTSSGKNKSVHNDLLHIEADGAGRVSATVKGTADWQGTSKLPGGVRNQPPVKDQGSGKIQFSIAGSF